MKSPSRQPQARIHTPMPATYLATLPAPLRLMLNLMSQDCPSASLTATLACRHMPLSTEYFLLASETHETAGMLSRLGHCCTPYVAQADASRYYAMSINQ